MPAEEDTGTVGETPEPNTATSDGTKWYRDQLDALHRQIGTLKVQLAEATAPQSAPAIVVRDETPPPPQTVKRTREFVEVEKPSRRLESLQKAMDLYVQKYPGGRSFVETIEAYADQIESGAKE